MMRALADRVRAALAARASAPEAHGERVPDPGTPSPRTLATTGVALCLVLLSAILGSREAAGDRLVLAVAAVGEALLVTATAAVLLIVGARLGATGRGRPWLLFGMGATLYAVGDWVWTWTEVVDGLAVPYPSPADIAYLAEYPFLAAGLVTAALAFRDTVPLRTPALIASVTGLATTGMLYVGLLRTTVLVAEVPRWERMLSTLYPLADVALLITPALLLLLIVGQLGAGRRAWPWYAASAAAMLIAARDTAYAWLSTDHPYAPGVALDYRWGAGHVLLLFGALVALDLRDHHPDAG